MDDVQKMPLLFCRPSDFSIEKILSKNVFSASSANYVECTPILLSQKTCMSFFNKNTTIPVSGICNPTNSQFNSLIPGNLNSDLSWLRCTRFHPPKLPKQSHFRKNLKRKPGSHPRIPFTKYQLDILETKYKKNAYLLKKDVLLLSDLLHLPQNRIKIWFQNRRARERRQFKFL